jgi:acyl-CoA synthetase (AMP-forming)/AMP-acid ligase II
MAITTVSDIIREHGVDRVDHTALIEGERRLTWGQLLDRSCRVANLLAAAGVGDQDRVAFLDKTASSTSRSSTGLRC